MTTQNPIATGPLMVPIATLQTMLAGLASVQDRFGLSADADPADSAARACDRIPFPALEDEEILTLLPSIVIGQGDKFTFAELSAGAQNFLLPDDSSLRMIFADKTHYADSLQAGMTDFGNWVGAVLLGLAAIAGRDTNLSISGFRQVMPIVCCPKEHEESVGLYFMTTFFVDWGM